MYTIIVVVLVLLVLGALPIFPYNRGVAPGIGEPAVGGWGWGPSGLLGTILVIALILWLLGVI